jgi:cytochrome c553
MNRMKRSRVLLLTLAAMLPLAATAQGEKKTGAPAAAGEAPVSMCIGCHAIPGYQA